MKDNCMDYLHLIGSPIITVISVDEVAIRSS